jgi:RsiW-degrading membrane proteinase PrsW (M82 family)
VSLVNIISLISTVFLAIIFTRRFRTKLNSHDASVMVTVFFMAMVTVIPALVIKYTASELGFGEHSYTLFGKIGYGAFSAFVFELNKYIVIIAYAYRQREFDEPMAGILITIMIGLGFTFAENGYYMLSGNDDFSGTWRVLVSIPVSMVCAVAMGFYSGMSKYGLDTDDLSSFGLRMRGLGTAILFHTFYNFLLFMEDYRSLVSLIIIGSILILILVGLNIIRARRLHTRLVYSRKKRAKNWEGD